MKLIKSLFHRLITRRPEWLDIKVVAILVLLSLFLIAMTWSEPLPTAHKAADIAKIAFTTALAQPINPEKTPTAIPVEWAEN